MKNRCRGALCVVSISGNPSHEKDSYERELIPCLLMVGIDLLLYFFFIFLL